MKSFLYASRFCYLDGLRPLGVLASAMAVMLFALSVPGCGVKSAPMSPEAARPERIIDLQAESSANGVRLNWTRPEYYAGGARMRDLSGFVILRADGDGPFHQLAELPVTDQERFQVQDKFAYIDGEAILGHQYRYEIISLTSDGYRSMPSNEASLTRVKPAPPPNPDNFVLPTPVGLPSPADLPTPVPTTVPSPAPNP